MSTSTLRKGTKSCAECRRRKIRCVRISQDADSCRQCEDRGIACTVQVSTNRSAPIPRFSSRLRIAQLESQVAQLTRVVNEIELKLGCKPSHIVEAQEGQPVGPDDSEGDSSGSDIPMAEKPSHLRSLFQNDWVSADAYRPEQQSPQRMDKAVAQLSMNVRPKLQSVIPKREEVADIAGSAYDWLTVLHAIFPQPLMLKSPQELLERYDSMCHPDADVIMLASWLLTLALTAQQTPRGWERSDVYRRKCRRRVEFCQSIISIVEKTLLCHDRLLGTVQGLGMAIHFLRLQVGQGNFQKAWIKLRHIIAIAELMGLPKFFQAARANPTSYTDETSLYKVQLWQTICNVERLLGMILNLPPGTARYRLIAAAPVVVNDRVNLPTYLTKLLDIAVKLYDLDEPSLGQESRVKMHTTALEMARSLDELAREVPDAWWAADGQEHISPDDIVQFVHCSVLMRVYLPLALRQNLGDQFAYARLPCMNACTSVARRYLLLRRKLPAGLFFSRILDLQALTAAAVLLLLSHHVCSDRHSFRVDIRDLDSVVSEVTDLIGERSKDPTNSKLAVNAYNTLRALSQLLRQDDHTAEVQRLTVTVPLLGKIHIRRNARPSQSSRVTAQLSSQQGPTSGAPKWNDIPPTLNTNIIMSEEGPTPEEWRFDDLSWSIEGNFDNLLEDTFLPDSIDPMSSWQDLPF
ncbi:hypothetical protein BDV28DRAFT_47863 [Aspergillus coremiiformis]|uniref:Zn(2)-C6 fungal-type domain-containing protein n=1 Tax=Aspergillus coremiiformis TaxID=138285 RepID=A0A5N6YXA2_9EURO|nr:hypothetical protein BDV28DRAFT_47863 [Aspergillus coremiiformis]